MKSHSSPQNSPASRFRFLVAALGVAAVFCLLPNSLAQEIPTPIETNPTATSTAVGEVEIANPGETPAAEAVSNVEIKPNSEAAAENSAERRPRDASPAIASVEAPGLPDKPEESEVIVIRSQVPEPLVNVRDEHRGLPAVKKTAGRVYLVLPDSNLRQSSALAAPPRISQNSEAQNDDESENEDSDVD